MARKTLNEMAKEYRKCPKTFLKYVRDLNIPHIQIGRDKLFDPEKVEKHLEELTLAGMQPEPDLKAKKVKKSIGRKPAEASSRYADLLGL